MIGTINIIDQRGEKGYTGSRGPAGNTVITFGNTTITNSLDIAISPLVFSSINSSVIVNALTSGIGIGLSNSIQNKFIETVSNGGAITSSNIVSPNWGNSSVFTYTVQSSFTLGTPLNMPIGATMTLIFTQDSQGARLLTANNNYKFAGGVNALSSASGAVDMLNIFKISNTTLLAAISSGYI